MKKNLRIRNTVLFTFFLSLFFTVAVDQLAFSQNWQLIHPVYPTTDDVVAGYSVADYGATGDGVTDVTSIFQTRLNALGAAGGGTLWVPAGKYVISGNLLIPKGVTLRGDWQQPVPGQPITGTILMAYAGRGDTAATPFITEQTACAVMDLAIWYPQQDPNNIVPYPNAIQMGANGFWGNDFNNAKNITLVNAYEGVELSLTNGGGCPVMMGIYGTPLSTGIMVDNIADVGRLENIDFSAAYWEGSGLPGSPSVGGAVEGYIYQHGTGILMRRDDWTYTSFVSVKGYNIGFRSALSIASPGAIPNGHNYGMTFTNCNTGIYFDGISNVGIMFANVTISNCTNGIVVGPGTTTNGAAQFHTCTIDATNAISTDPTSVGRFMMERCTISRGKVDIGGGTFMANDCDFNNASPQITMEKNSRSIITGDRFHVARKIVNNSLWLSAIDSTTTFTLKQLPAFPTIVPETHQAARQVMYLASAAPYNAKNDGTTDNTNAIQSALNQAAADGGGVVFLPPGHYRVNGDLTIASGVELKGASDLSAAPYGPGSVLEVTADAGNATGTPFLKLAANSGVRGIVFDYPNQTGSLVPNFPAYPYTIQGTGSNIYIINIGFRSVYNGIDLFTNKCDNHYVDYVCGQVFQNVFTVGGASTGGKIYNAHFNTIYYANGEESKFGSWPNSPTTDGDPAVYNYNYDNCKFLNLGNCQNETLYNDFIYGSQQGVNLNSDAGSAPTGISLGLGIDGTRNSMNFNAIGAAGFDFINTQTVALGDAGNRYITTTPTFASANTTLFNSDYWGNPPNGIILNGGTLNLQQANFNQPGQTNFGQLTSGLLNVFGSAIWPVNAELNAGAEHLLNAQSSIIDSSNIIRPNVAVWKNNLGNAWAVNPIKAMSRWGWTATASVDNGEAQNALDSNETTRWATTGVQAPGQSYIVDMKNLKQFYEIALENAASSGDYPAGYAVYVSTDGVNWGSPVATGVGSSGLTIITFPTQVARYIKVVQTGSTTGNWWSIFEFYVFGVDYHAVTGVTVSPGTATINAGTTKQLTAIINPTTASDTVVTWVSSDPTKATVDSTGLVTSITVGTVTITATTQDGGKTAISTITINPVTSPGVGKLNYPALLGYWQDWDDPTSPFIPLDQVDPKYNNVIVAFATPINGNEYQIGFTPYNTTQATFITQIQALQSQGRKVLISIGGEGAPVSITSTAQEAIFVSSVESIINTYGYDGVDIDFEGTSLSISGGTITAPVDAPEIYLIAGLKQIMQDYRAAHGKKLLLTMAPETADVQGGISAYGGVWGSYLPIINGLKDSLDVLQTQLYNSGTMYGLDGNVYTVGTADFIVAETEAAIKGFTTAGGLYVGLPANKVAVGLPSCVTAAGSGFTDTATVRAAMDYLLGKGPKPGSYTLEQAGGYPTLEGMMDWSINYDKFCSNDSYAVNFDNIFDSTIVPTTTETPYGGTPWPIPGTIQSEDYDNGGQGTAYNDSDPTNDGGQYRPTEGVDVEASADGGFDVGYTAAGEWLKYTVNVVTPGIYTMQSRVAANSATGTFHVNMDATNISGTVAVPNTGGFQYWQTINTTTTYLTAGQHVMTVFIDAAGFNINYITFAGPVTAGLTASIAAPLNNVIYNAPASLPITANVSTTTGTITKVEFYANGTKIGESDVAPYTFNWTGVAAGTYNITAKVTNSSAATTVSIPVLVTVNAAIPSCPLLTWSDEFNGNSLDLTKWGYQTGNGCPGICGWGNNELEYYTNNTNNVSVSGGALALTAQYQANYLGSGNNYTSGKILTVGNFSQKYGHFEARIKVPSAAGTWPAFWMLADSTAWPQTGEIDIEECANKNPVTWFGTLHFANAGGSHLSQGYTYNSPAPLSDDYHLYAADWTTDSISFYVDSVLRGTVSKTAVIAAGGVWPFDNQKFYIILNLAVGGNFTGQTPNPADFPQSMLVDYVRVYSKNPCVVVPETPYGGTPWPIPGTIQAENYDNGGQGTAYNDSDPTNDGGQYRTTEGVDVETCTDAGGGYDVGYTAAGEWEKYTVNVNTAGVYTMQARVASITAGNSLHVEIDGVTIGTIAVPNSGDFQTFQTVSVTTPALTTGQHIMRIYMETGGFNLNYVTFLLPASVPVISSAPTATGTEGTAIINYTITASNGPTSYAITNLPAGLNLNTTTGVISGTPIVSGTFIDTLKAINGGGTGTKILTFTIAAGTVENDLTQKLMMGYQGWFLAQGDNSASNDWRHWFHSTTDPSAAQLNVDIWPDMSEYKTQYPTTMTYPGGATAKLFSSHDSSTVNTHFRWMRDYNIYGVYLQRFLGEVVNDPRFFKIRNDVTKNVANASQLYGRHYAIMYDISGVPDDGTLYTKLVKDWEYLVDSQNITTQSVYVKQKGLPVVAIWGIGFAGRGLKVSTFDSLINYFHNLAPAKYRAYVVGGVPGQWRTLDGDSETDSSWLGVYHSLDMISPWAVGRYGDNAGADNWKTQRIVPDLANCNTNNVSYMPVIFPGFSWHNENAGVLNQIPRNGGNFYWHQAYNAKSAGSNFIYVAMFDEADEGTAMYKAAPTAATAPAQGSFVTLDADGYNCLPSDWYLQLANETQKMLDGTSPTTSVIPLNPDRCDTVSVASSGSITEGGAAGTFIIKGTNVTSTITVNYTISGTASTADYTASPVLSGSVTLTPTAPSVTVNINALTDGTTEPTETLILTLNPATTYTASTTPATISIIDAGAPAGCSTSMVVNATSVPVIDGTVDPVWSNAPKNLIAQTISGTIQTGSTWQAMYDATNLYVLVQVKDANLSSVGTNIYDQDGVELFLSGNNSKAGAYTALDHQYRFNWNVAPTIGNITGNTGSTTGITYAIPTSTGGYTLEAAIPWTTIGGAAPYNGEPIGFDVDLNDQQDGTGAREATAGWYLTNNDDYQNTAGFGTVNLTVCAATAPVISSANTASGTVGTAFTYTITATNTPTSYAVGGTLPAGVTINTTTGVISGTPTGIGTFIDTVKAINAGGTGTQIVTITINPAKPVITSNTATGTVGTAFSYTITATNSPTSYTASPLPAGLSFNTTTGVLSGTPTTVATTTVNISATNAGGTGNGTVVVTINPAKPVITSNTATGTVGTAFSYTITATNSPTSYTASPLPAGLSFNTTTGVLSGTPTTVATTTVSISATNAGGTGNGIVVVTINPAKPVITSNTATGTVGTAFSYTITATNNPTSYTASPIPAGLSFNTTTGVLSGTPSTAATTTISISATNAGGTGNGTVVVTINAAIPGAPVVTSNTAAGTVGTAFSYTITATNTPTSYTASPIPAGLSFNTTTGVLSGTPTTAATTTISISATNVGGTGNGTVVVTINPAVAPPSAPIITSNGSVTGAVGSPFTYTITATNSPTSYGAAVLPAGLTINTTTGVITGVPTIGGVFTVTITATNAGGSANNILRITISTPAAPVITSDTSITVNEKESFEYDIVAENTPTSYAAVGLPEGLTIDPTTGIITGKPTVPGSYKVTLEATNAVGTGTETLDIIVVSSAPISSTPVLWPDPAAVGGSVTVTLPGWVDKKANIEIINYLGMVVESLINVTIQYSTPKNIPMVNVEIFDIERGDYIMVIRGETDKVVEKFMVK